MHKEHWPCPWNRGRQTFPLKVQVTNGFKFSATGLLFSSVLLESCTKELQKVHSGQTSRHGCGFVKLSFYKQVVGNIWHTLYLSNPDILATCCSITDWPDISHLFILGHNLMEHTTVPQVTTTKMKQTLFQLTTYWPSPLTQPTQSWRAS